MASPLRVRHGSREWLVSVDAASVTIDGVDGVFTLAARPDGRWVVTRDGRDHVASGVATPQSVWTSSNAVSSAWQVEPASTRHRHGAADDHVRAPMSATVLRVHVKAGDPVSEGDPLAVVEAMKMEMPLRAPRDGVIKAVHCQEGELVQSADVLVELE